MGLAEAIDLGKYIQEILKEPFRLDVFGSCIEAVD